MCVCVCVCVCEYENMNKTIYSNDVLKYIGVICIC